MASEVDWSSLIGKTQQQSQRRGAGSGLRSNFVRFEDGKSYRVRPVGGVVQYVKLYDPAVRRSVIVECEDGSQAAAILSEHSGRHIKPKDMIAVNVIDRSDGEIRIMECVPQIWKHFAHWVKNNNNTPLGGLASGDWSIEVTNSTGERINREYIPGFIGSTPLTKDEINKVKEIKEKYSLKEIFKGVPLSEIIDKMYGERPDRDRPQERNTDTQHNDEEQATATAGISESDLAW